MAKEIKVAIAGINGRFGRASAKAILADNELELVGGFGRNGAGYAMKDLSHLIGGEQTGIVTSNTFLDLLDENKPDVLLDFTKAEAVFDIAKLAIERGVRPVVGTSGVDAQVVKLLTELARKEKLGAMVVPNFSLGAVLMMEFAKQAGAHFEDVEIIEMHNTGKADAPSGTAMATANKIAAAGNKFNKPKGSEHMLLEGARGGAHASGVRVHSLRLPGLISHQEVVFGAPGELLTIRHDGLTTECYMRGVLLAIKAVTKLDQLVVGLENILFSDKVLVS
jgi:4-hydroxy-tetrahydrodipicolinate reductase